MFEVIGPATKNRAMIGYTIRQCRILLQEFEGMHLVKLPGDQPHPETLGLLSIAADDIWSSLWAGPNTRDKSQFSLLHGFPFRIPVYWLTFRAIRA